MTTVYIARGHIDYEGFDILGVYATPAEAAERCREVQADEDYSRVSFSAWTVGNRGPDRTHDAETVTPPNHA